MNLMLLVSVLQLPRDAQPCQTEKKYDLIHMNLVTSCMLVYVSDGLIPMNPVNLLAYVLDQTNACCQPRSRCIWIQMYLDLTIQYCVFNST